LIARIGDRLSRPCLSTRLKAMTVWISVEPPAGRLNAMRPGVPGRVAAAWNGC
jgi:hypothetical protein